MPINKAGLLQKLLGYGEEHVGDLTKYFKNPENVEVVNDLVRKKAPKVLKDIEGEVVENSPRLITQAEQSAAPIVEDIADSVAPKATKATMMDAINGLTPTQKAIGGAGLVTAASAPLFMNSTSDTELPKLAEPVAKPSVQKELPPQQEVKKSQTTGKKSVVDNALTESSPEITQLNAQQHSPIDDYNQKLLDARQQDNEHNLLFGMLKAAQMGGSALAGSKSDTSFADAELAKNNEMTNQLKTNTEMTQEKQKMLDEQSLRDPNTPLYKMVSAQYKQAFGKELPAGVTPLQLKAMGLDIDAINNAIMRKETHADDRALKMAQIEAMHGQKSDILKTKDANAYATWLTGQTKGRSGIVQTALAQVQRGESLNEMFNALPKKSDGSIDFGTAGKAHKEELIKAIDLMLSGGKSTIAGSEHLRGAYGTAFDELATIRQKIAGDNLPSLGQQKIVHQLYDLMDRETNVARLQAARNLDAGGSKAFKSLTPEEKRQQIQQLTGISPEEQALINDQKVSMPMMVQLRAKGIDPVQALQAVRSGKKIEEVLGQSTPKSTTISNKVPSGMVKIMGPDGKTHYIPSENVDKAVARGAKVVQ